MPSIRQLVLASIGLLGLSRAAPAPSVVSTPIPPSQDPWYSAPDGFEYNTPGTVLRLRPAPGNLTGISNTSAVWNILYRTTDSHYKPSWAVTTLFVPQKPDPCKLLSYQLAYDSPDIDDGPSYLLQSATVQSFSTLEPAFAQGWFISIPDYEGPNGSFTAGITSGLATIDSVRAILSLSEKLGLAEDVKYALWGYSGGALATEWAAELQEQYAPELNFAGAALGGLTPNIANVLKSTSGTANAGLVPSALLGLTTQYPDARALLVASLKTSGPLYNATTFLSALNLSSITASVQFQGQDISKYFVGGFASILNSTILRAIYREGVMGLHGVPQMPMFAYKAINDEVSPVADTDDLLFEYCSVGANVLYQRNTVGQHNDEEANGYPAAFSWLTSIFDGTYNTTYSTSGCTIQNVTVNAAAS